MMVDIPRYCSAINEKGEDGYMLLEDLTWFSERYGKHVSEKKGYWSDGSTLSLDIRSLSWWIHDILCDRGTWDDGNKLTVWQCSMCLFDIMIKEGYTKTRSSIRFFFTFICGGGKCRDYRFI